MFSSDSSRILERHLAQFAGKLPEESAMFEERQRMQTLWDKPPSSDLVKPQPPREPLSPWRQDDGNSILDLLDFDNTPDIPAYTAYGPAGNRNAPATSSTVVPKPDITHVDFAVPSAVASAMDIPLKTAGEGARAVPLRALGNNAGSSKREGPIEVTIVGSAVLPVRFTEDSGATVF